MYINDEIQQQVNALFTDEATVTELGFNPDAEIEKRIELDQAIRAVAGLQKKTERIQAEKQEAVEFYDKRIATVQSGIDYIQAKTEKFVKAQIEGTRDKSVSVPAGIAGYRKSTKASWPGDDVLIAYSHEHGIPTREVPQKKEIKVHMKANGIAPAGYIEDESTSFYLTPKLDKKEKSAMNKSEMQNGETPQKPAAESPQTGMRF